MTTLQLPEVIHTPRLLLRPYRFEDVDDVLAYACDEEWSRYLIGVPNPYRRADALQFLARQTLLDRAVHPAWAVVFEDAVVGGVNIRFKFDYAIADMGWSINRLLWGRGMATEAAQAVVDAAFTTHPQLKRIAATADERNVPSCRVMEKIGMRREGSLRQSRVAGSELIDEAHFGLLRAEWEKGRAADRG